MVKRSAGSMPSVSAMGKPTEMTGVPQAPMGAKEGVMDGIVKGVPRNLHTPMVDGLVKTACSHKATDGVHPVKPSATKIATQEFGSVPFGDAKLGRM